MDRNTLPPVSDSETTTEKARRWSAFVCPDCRFVFRVPRDHDGTGIICPSCRRMLRIPQEGDAISPLMASLQKINFSDGEIDPRGEKRTRSKRKKRAKEAESPDWDVSAGKWKSIRSDKRSAVGRGVVGVVLVLVSAGLIFLAVKEDEKTEGSEDLAGLPGADEFQDLTDTRLLLSEEELEDEIELPKVMQRSEVEFIEEAEPLAEKFLNATSVDEILPLIRDSETVGRKVRDYYPDGSMEAIGMEKFNSAGRPSYKNSFAAVSILTPDYEEKQLAFIDTEEGLKIDWESWVGWSEVPWDELTERRPTRPVLVRAMLKWIDYYNFGFSDEEKWRSYRLTSPDGEQVLYGYVERNSLLDQRLRPNESGASVAATLKIHFPDDDGSRPQVIIDEQVADGWVVSE